MNNENDILEEKVPEIQFECDNGEPLHLIRFEDGNFELVQETAEHLLNFSGTISFVGICGKYRTGKSFLINKLLGLKKSSVI